MADLYALERPEKDLLRAPDESFALTLKDTNGTSLSSRIVDQTELSQKGGWARFSVAREPARIPQPWDGLELSAGDAHSLILKPDGTLSGMGANLSGQLGLADGNDSLTPSPIDSAGVTQVTAGAHHSLYLKQDGSAWAMDKNDSGQIGTVSSWFTPFAGSVNVNDLDTDAVGSIYASGTFNGSANFGTTPTVTSTSTDIYVAKLNTSGEVQWVSKSDGPSGGNALGLGVDSSGNAYVTGNIGGTMRFNGGAITLNLQRESDPFFAKISNDGNWLSAQSVGTSAWSSGYDMETDAEGNQFVTGYYYSTASFGSTSLSSSGWYDAFVGKINSSGVWQWAIKYGGGSFDQGDDLAIMKSGNLAIIGNFRGITGRNRSSSVMVVELGE